ncbi:uncharacterized protein LOC127088210 [Lathyrus oleraceus]|uniref:uncharacterized protein LOC127088210 n=1 Tax=Pisum sativum TaxID=3888 RepID=UPI0021CE1D5A|nr:uncharacterized protein LOC127088210 [Pisum sativum]
MVAWNKKSLKVEMLDISFQHINMKAMFQEGIKWHFITVYASLNEDKRRVLQEDLKKITDRINGAWMIVGDFNDISSSLGKKGGAQVSIRRCKTFRERINNYKLIDINMIGPKFIWCRPIYHGGQRIYERLDKALCNDDWSFDFPEARVKVLARVEFSNHHPILTYLNKGHNFKIQKRFRFESA